MATPLELNAHEARVLGVLIEKQLTTPDQYPLSLNAITQGANQKSNRDPQTDYSEAEVVVALQGLVAKHLAGRSQPAGSRVERFHHSALAMLEIEEPESAVLAELLLRGAQQPGELRTRASRMSAIDSQERLAQLLGALESAGWVRNLGRRSGERAERWGQTLAPEAAPAESAALAPQRSEPAARAAAPADLAARVGELEARVARLEQVLGELGG